ncbi:MAG: hypothetical protein AAGK92_14180 [Pseudomonadota bacterium]
MTLSQNGSLAFLTMVRDDDFFLRLWVNHYRQIVEPENLFILFDGQDQDIPDFAADCRTIRLPQAVHAEGWDDNRWAMLSDIASGLTRVYDRVVVNDVDELIVIDPDHPVGLRDYILDHPADVISPFALEVVHRTDVQPDPFDAERPLLSQRPHVRINASYCKPCITSVPLRWSLGGHYSSHPELYLDRNLYLFHLRYFDREMLLSRQAQRNQVVSADTNAITGSIAGDGWSKPSAKMQEFLESFIKAGAPEETDFLFDWQRRRVEKVWTFSEEEGFYRHGKIANRRTYILPERFRSCF